MYLLKETKVYNQSLRSSLGASNSVTDFSALSNPSGAQNMYLSIGLLLKILYLKT